MIPVISVIHVTLFVVLGAASPPPLDPIDNDFSPLLFLFFIIGVCIVLLLLVLSIAAAIAIAASAAFLVAAGTISSSAIIGVLRGRFSSGLRAFHYQVCALAAVPASIGALWAVYRLFELPLHPRDLLVIGTASGIVAGVTIAYVFDRLGRLAYERFIEKHIPVRRITTPRVSGEDA